MTIMYEGPRKTVKGMIVIMNVGTPKSAREMSDAEIVELYFERDEFAIEVTDRKYRRYLLRIAYNILHDPEEGEECLDDTYLGAWNSIPPTRPSSLGAFLSVIMRRGAINRYKTKIRAKSIPSDMTVALSELEGVLPGDDGTSEVDSHALGELINDFLQTITPRERYIFIGRYYFAETVERIADELMVSRSTVNKEISKIKASLQSKLESEGYSI